MDQVYRKELKYVVSLEKVFRIRSRLSSFLDYDSNSNEEGYIVRSLYFDALNDKDLFDTLYGLNDKHKIRLRIYSIHDKQVKLEWKRKSGSDSHKITFMITRENAESMINGDYDFLRFMGNEHAQSIYALLVREAYRPKTIVEYQRVAYVHPISNIRICFDYHIKASLTPFNFFDENIGYLPLLSVDQTVLEVKYDDFMPTLIKEILSPLDELSQANSKYVQARML